VNACMAASHVAEKPRVTSRSSWKVKSIDHSQGVPDGEELNIEMRPTTWPSAMTRSHFLSPPHPAAAEDRSCIVSANDADLCGVVGGLQLRPPRFGCRSGLEGSARTPVGMAVEHVPFKRTVSARMLPHVEQSYRHRLYCALPASWPRGGLCSVAPWWFALAAPPDLDDW
jgi:hypothetical protein